MALSKLISGSLTSPTYRQSDLNRIFNLSDALVNALAQGSINGQISATTATPVGTYTKGDLIRNSRPTEITTSWGKYVVLGWICTDDSTTPGVFKDVRVLTSDITGGSASTGAPTSATYLTLSNDATLTNERVLATGFGLLLTDGGANGTAVLSVQTSVLGGVSGAPVGASYLTLGTDPILTSERVLAAASPLLLTDGGAGATAVLSLATSIPATGAPLTATYLTLSTDTQLQNERVLAVSSPLLLTDGGAGATAVLSLSTSIPSTGAPTTAQYLVLANDAGLSAERVLAVASPLSLADGGANGTATLSLSTSIPATGAPVSASYLVLGNDPNLTAERVLSVASPLSLVDGGANGTAVLSLATAIPATGAPVSASYLVLGLDSTLTNERLLTVGAGLTLTDGGANATAVLSASTLGAPTGAAYLTLSNDPNLTSERVLAVTAPLSLVDGGANGTAVLSLSTSIPATGAPLSSQYLVLALDGQLTNERQLAVGYGLALTDGGANATATLSVQTAVLAGGGAPSSAQYVVLATDATLTAERVLAAGTALSLTDNGAGQTASLSVTVDDTQLILASMIFGQ